MNFHENRMFSNAPLNSKRGGGKGPTSPWFYRRKPLISQTINCFHIFDDFEWHSFITKQIIATMPISVNCSENKGAYSQLFSLLLYNNTNHKFCQPLDLTKKLQHCTLSL